VHLPVTADLIPANPMPQAGRPKITKTLPKALHHNVASELVAATENDEQQRRSDWSERDRAILLTALLAGLRSEELINSNVGDHRRTAEGAVIHVRGKGNKDRRIPIEAALVDVIEHYLDSRHQPTADDRQTPLPHRGTGRLATERTAVCRHNSMSRFVPRRHRVRGSLIGQSEPNADGPCFARRDNGSQAIACKATSIT
jgi:site-specific recombinase XerC